MTIKKGKIKVDKNFILITEELEIQGYIVDVGQNIDFSKAVIFKCQNSQLDANNIIYLPKRENVQLDNCDLTAKEIIYLDDLVCDVNKLGDLPKACDDLI